ncbi:testis-expressed protein 9-like [Cololabis saira]|uniref:testis-expressed protein 9-like n=1 Tax=Cololabis saira TaxID=129043 RepID=UPI002AD30F40|nr:testis-expressed protein 9-like [Cololabis saira]
MDKRPSTTGKSEKSKQVQLRPVSAPTTYADDLLAQEERYKLMNAELEAKTTDLVRQAEQLVSEQNEALSKPLPSLLSNIELDSRKSNESAEAKVEDAMDIFSLKAVQNIEEKMNEAGACEDFLDDAEDSTETGVLDAQTQVLKAKLRILQEEVDQLSSKYYKKDDENAQLSAKIKELEEDRAKLQKTASIQKTETEKHKTLVEESSKEWDGIQLQVSALNKEIENLTRTQKKAAATHTSVEVRLNRALEEKAKLKTELKATKRMTKHKIRAEHESRENLLAENKLLMRQKAELIVGLKKQMKLISIQKRSAMHNEVGKQLFLTEEEINNALDLGKS